MQHCGVGFVGPALAGPFSPARNALYIGAIFMKLGRAPATDRYFVEGLDIALESAPQASAKRISRKGAGAQSERLPFLPLYPSFPKDAHQQPAADVLFVGIRYPQLPSTPFHVLVIAARHWRLEAQLTEAGDKVFPFDWTNRRHQATWGISRRRPSISGISE